MTEKSTEQVLEHPSLGRLTFNQDLDWWEANVKLQGCWIKLYLSVEELEFDTDALLSRGVDYLNWARETESKVRQKIADDLLEIYNEVWACDEDEEDDGPGQMSREEFIEKITPESLTLHGDDSGAWYYNDNDLFAGHSIEIRVNQDQSFGEAHLAG